MADEQREQPDAECRACRGTGQVISNLGGSAQSVACPWCRGTGRRIPGLDAQAERSGAQDDPPPAAA